MPGKRREEHNAGIESWRLLPDVANFLIQLMFFPWPRSFSSSFFGECQEKREGEENSTRGQVSARALDRDHARQVPTDHEVATNGQLPVVGRGEPAVANDWARIDQAPNQGLQVPAFISGSSRPSRIDPQLMMNAVPRL